MLTFVPENIEQYAVDHTSALPPYLMDLMAHTRNHVERPQMLSGPIEGSLLQFLVWTTGARRVLEIGTFTGFSSQMMAEALPDDGLLITCDIDPEAEKVAREFYAKSPHGHKIDLRMGPALETLQALQGETFDVVFIDADKSNYPKYYEAALGLLAPRGVIAIDNVLWSGKVLDPQDDESRTIASLNETIASDPRVRHVLLPIRDGVMLVRRV